MRNLKVLLIIQSVSFLTVNSLDKAEPVTVQLQRDVLMNTFKAALSSDYMQRLVKEFAKKATSHLIEEVKNKEQQLYQYGTVRQSAPLPMEAVRQVKNKAIQPAYELKENRPVNESQETLQIENDDQDTLRTEDDEPENIHSGNLVQEIRAAPSYPADPKEDTEQVLINERDAYALINEPSPDGDNLYTETDDLTDDEPKSDIPVIEVRKINGVYYRRLLGMISNHE